ncbi:hypothetical protein [Actinophytocola sp.]|uniref:hypothetical protein n=1 Tax=Actinophytocola sp. TaxID=1872138 RepID=UPI0038998274
MTLRKDDPPHQIVFGGDSKLDGGELVAVAPPGSWAITWHPVLGSRRKKMRARNYRGQRSHGMLCSLDELGWLRNGPNEVAILCDLTLGDSLDDLPTGRRSEIVVDWERAKLAEKRAQTAADTMTADFRTLPYVSTPGAPVATLVAENGTTTPHPA